MNNKFIGIDEKIVPPFKSTSLLLRRCFNVRNINHSFVLYTIGLGIAVYYVNGQPITDSVLCTPNSDYSKSLYIEKYDVTPFVKKGKNVIAVELGNGFYKESLETVWKINHAHWRGEKCLYLKLKADDRTILQSDNKFKALYSPFTTYNELRAGECFNKRKLISFQSLDFDDSNWTNAVFIKNPPKGKMIENYCPPIKEFERFKPIKVTKSKKGYIFDFGRNMSGYVFATISKENNHEISFQYAEDIDSSGEIELHNLNCYQKGEPFQLDTIIPDGTTFSYKPKFTYHGFRYVEITGLEDLSNISLEAIFVHQDIKYLKPKTELSEIYQKMFDAGINSILSNTYYGFTDCPTREKLNWLNDLTMSLPVIMKYFECRQLLLKVYCDILDSQDSSGNIPGIAPSPNWGYEYGPLCGGLVIILPYLFFKQYDDKTLFTKNISKIKKYYRFVKKNINSSYFFLGDWTGSTNHSSTPVQFVLETYMYIFDKILLEITGLKCYKKDSKIRERNLLSYKVVGQTIPSVLLDLNLGNKDKVLDALVKDIVNKDYHLDVGMFGFQYLFKVLSENSRDDLIKKIVCNNTPPSFKVWIDNGATTLYETFGETWSLSMNHHMYSSFIRYLK